jgi:hypothetical protein
MSVEEIKEAHVLKNSRLKIHTIAMRIFSDYIFLPAFVFCFMAAFSGWTTDCNVSFFTILTVFFVLICYLTFWIDDIFWSEPYLHTVGVEFGVHASSEIVPCHWKPRCTLVSLPVFLYCTRTNVRTHTLANSRTRAHVHAHAERRSLCRVQLSGSSTVRYLVRLQGRVPRDMLLLLRRPCPSLLPQCLKLRR